MDKVAAKPKKINRFKPTKVIPETKIGDKTLKPKLNTKKDKKTKPIKSIKPIS